MSSVTGGAYLTRAVQRATKTILIGQSASRLEEIVPVIDAVRAAGGQAFNVRSSVLFFLNRTRIIEHVAMVQLATIHQWPEWAEESALVSQGPRKTAICREIVARRVVKVPRGAKPADIPVEQPTLFELAINLT
jgi:putative tryptophan/tyrosine transport system substrate-binding protein